MKCLVENCKNEFESKTGRRKFCSDKCKLKYFRKHGKKNTASKFEITSILNEVKAAIQELKDLRSGKITGQPMSLKSYDTEFKPRSDDEPKQWQEPEETISFQEAMNLLADCVYPPEFEKLWKRVQKSKNITEKQKQLFKINMSKSNL